MLVKVLVKIMVEIFQTQDLLGYVHALHNQFHHQHLHQVQHQLQPQHHVQLQFQDQRQHLIILSMSLCKNQHMIKKLII